MRPQLYCHELLCEAGRIGQKCRLTLRTALLLDARNTKLIKLGIHMNYTGRQSTQRGNEGDHDTGQRETQT